MLLTAEIRWFWRGEIPREFEAWFCQPSPGVAMAGGGGVRVDEYLADAGQIQLGVKRRGGTEGLEIKGLVSCDFAMLSCPPFAGPIELWCKWRSDLLVMPSERIIAVQKRRRLRRFIVVDHMTEEIPLDPSEIPLKGKSLPLTGCNVELTRISLQDGSCWWTFGFEALGTLQSVVPSLTLCAQAMADRCPPPVEPGWISSYPAWLARELQAPRN